MKLIDAIFLSTQMSEDAVIFARKPFHQNSDARIVNVDDGSSLPVHIPEDGYTFFLEKECVEQLLEMISPKRSSRATKAEFLCHYVSWNVCPAWYFDLDDLSVLNE